MVGALGRRGLLLGGAGRRTPCAERAVMLTAVQSLRLLVRRGACWEGAGRRTPCAERAVILTAVQSLRLAGSAGGVWGEGLGFEALVGEVAGRMPVSLWGPGMDADGFSFGSRPSGALGWYAAFLQSAGVRWWRTQSVALGWYGVSRWDTGRCGERGEWREG